VVTIADLFVRKFYVFFTFRACNEYMYNGEVMSVYPYVSSYEDRLCGLVVRVLGYRSRGLGSIPGTTKKNSGSGTGSTQPREYN
jgi:hypothetical protein